MDKERTMNKADFERADELMQRMDHELCGFLNDNDVFCFEEEDLHPHLLAITHMFCQKAGRTLASMFIAGETQAEDLLCMASDLIEEHFHAALRSATDKLLDPTKH